jgi:hypothetical protein
MKIDYGAHAKLYGTAPSSERGGPLSEGSVAKTVTEGLTYIGRGYVNVRVEGQGLTLGEADIKEVLARTDFSKL